MSEERALEPVYRNTQPFPGLILSHFSLTDCHGNFAKSILEAKLLRFNAIPHIAPDRHRFRHHRYGAVAVVTYADHDNNDDDGRRGRSARLRR